MRELARLGVRSIVLASGTLSPMGSYAAELALPFPVRLENPHVVDADQVFLGVLKAGVHGRPLNSSYAFRDTPEYKRELGATVAALARVVPDGLLVFFSSYSALDAAVAFWRGDNGGETWARLAAAKAAVVVEPRAGHFPETAAARTRFIAELREWALSCPCSVRVKHIVFQRALPVDVRHNAKIHRLQLAKEWTSRLAR